MDQIRPQIGLPLTVDDHLQRHLFDGHKSRRLAGALIARLIDPAEIPMA
jgi:hypothetical protein